MNLVCSSYLLHKRTKLALDASFAGPHRSNRAYRSMPLAKITSPPAMATTFEYSEVSLALQAFRIIPLLPRKHVSCPCQVPAPEGTLVSGVMSVAVITTRRPVDTGGM